MGVVTKLFHDKVVYSQRVMRLKELISPMLGESTEILDLGCGDGKIDSCILEERRDISIKGIDVLVRPITYIDVKEYDGKKIPYADNSFDTVMAIDVLHHTDNPLEIVKEMTRVASKYIIIKDHIKIGFISYLKLRVMDYVGNSHYHVRLTYNYLTEEQWNEIFKENRLVVKEKNYNLNLYKGLFHLLFDCKLHFVAKLEKSNEILLENGQITPKTCAHREEGGGNLTEEYYCYNNPFISLREYFSLRARSKMYAKFMDICSPKDTDKILDLGATPDMKLQDSNFLEKLYPHPENITICSIEDCSEVSKTYGCGGVVCNKPKERLPFNDKQFDILFCSATLEHVGKRDDQIFFLNECLRVANKVFLTTPNRYFPIEMHTFIPILHWLPWPLFQRIVGRWIGPFYADINNLNLLAQKDIRRMKKELIKEVKIHPVYTLGIKSNLIITL